MTRTLMITLLSLTFLSTACNGRREPRARPDRIELRERPRTKVPLHGREPRLGDAAAPISVVAFVDYPCPASTHVPGVLDETVKKNPDVQVIYKVAPFQLGLSVLPARAVCAADMQGRFHDMNRRLAAAVPKQGRGITHERIVELAAELGLDISRFTRDMQSARCTDRLRDDRDDADDARVRDTPTLFVNGRPVAGAMYDHALAAAIVEERRIQRGSRKVASSGHGVGR